MKTMEKGSDGVPMRWLVTACALAMVLTLPQAGVAQQAPAEGAAKPDASKFESVPLSSLMPGAAPARPVAKPSEEEEESPAKPSKPGGEGIKVHGHWVIDLKDPDGKVVEHRDFQNSLVQTTTNGIRGGDWLLANVLSGNVTPGGLSIAFTNVNTTTNTDPTTFCNSTNNCYWFISSNNIGFYNDTTGLISTLVLANGTTNLTSSLVLSGNYTIPSGLNTITAVQTWLTYCEPTASQTAPGFLQADLAPSGCVASAHTNEGGEFPLTSTIVTSGTPPVATPLNVTPGQVITVTVTISFS